VLIAPALSANELKKRLTLKSKEEQIEDKADKALADPVSIGFAWPTFHLGKSHVGAGPSILSDACLEYDDIVSLSSVPDTHLVQVDKLLLKLLPGPTSATSTAEDRKGKGRKKASDDLGVLQALYKEVLADLEYIMLGNTVDLTLEDGTIRRARVMKASIGGKIAPKGVYYIPAEVDIEVQGASKPRREDLIPARPTGSFGLPTGYENVGGLDRHIAQIRELVELPLTRPELYNHFALQPPRGILLHGPPGTGKTLLASSIAASLQLPLISIDGPSLSSPYHGETEQRLRDVFEEAEDCAPSIIVIDEVDALVPAREDAGEVERRVVATLLTLMDGLGGKEGQQAAGTDDGTENQKGKVIVIAATNRPNAIDQALRRPGRFDREIEIGVPDADARLSILKVLLRRTPHQLPDSLLKEIAGKTHGYVGADLSALIHTAGLNAIRRLTATKSQALPLTAVDAGQPEAEEPTITLSQTYLLESDVEAAMLATRPSALRSVFLETPQVSWTDIGGQSVVKQKLQEVIEWPLRHPETFKRLGVAPPRGILLYGPPGCSKTLIARALASGAGVNFIAVKGPEVFNKYVGESERTIRETFRKARAAAPCIVFMDEIDVIAGSRDDGDGGGGSSDRILTTLLTEMDGIEELHGVTVLAATNRPDVIDSALMRPGRLDRILYVAPPDKSARTEIFRVNFQKMAVNADVDIERLAEMTEGCSGAEVVAICQDAAFNAMNEDLDAVDIRMKHLEQAAEGVRRRITPEMIDFYETWRDSAGVREV